MANKSIVCSALLLLASVLAAGCQTAPAGPVLATLPPVDPDDAVTLHFRTGYNSTQIEHDYLVSIDGLRVAHLPDDTKRTLQIAAGEHELKIACYLTNRELQNAPRGVNFGRPDFTKHETIDTEPGDELCFKLHYNPLSCALITESSISYCSN